MNAAILKITLILVFLALVLAGCAHCTKEEMSISKEVRSWETTPAGVPVPRY